MACLGLEPGAAGWKAQTNPLSYGGAPNPILVAQTGHQYFTQKTLTVGGSITVRLVSSFTILDWADLPNTKTTVSLP